MLVSLSWLQEFVAVDLPPDELGGLLTRTGLEVASITTRGVETPQVVVARIDSSEQHPNADRLSVCRVEDGSGTPRQIVCGAKNYRVGDKVPLALPGAVLPGNFKIKAGKLRGVLSEGMLCSGRELGLSTDAEGLLILAPDAPIGTAVSELFPPETVFELEITPNRADWLSHLGVAREIAAFSATAVHWQRPADVPTAGNEREARIAADAACPFYSLRRIRGVKVGPSPDWMRRRLEAVGLRAINNVVDVTNFVMFELGQPLHAFDAAKVAGGIEVRPAVGGEKFVALDGTTCQLAAGDTVIANANGALALGGVMGGAGSGVTAETTEVLLESALFVPAAIRRTARRLGMQSDSSYRFERSVDPGMVLAASNRACALILEVAGGVADAEVIVAGQLPPAPPPVRIRHERCRSLLGAPLANDEITASLAKLGLKRIDTPKDPDMESTWQPPGFRSELAREADLIEEVVRLAGIERIPSIVTGAGQGRLAADAAYDAANLLREKLVSAGFSEARLSALVAESDLGDRREHAVCLKNPLGTDQAFLRPSLRPGLLAAARRNFHLGANPVRLFEIGAVFSSAAPEQRSALALVASGRSQPQSWTSNAETAISIFEIKGLLQMLFRGRIEFVPTSSAGFAAAAEIRIAGRLAGVLGVLAPATARALDAPSDIVVAEIELPVPESAGPPPVPRFQAIAKFPATSRDLAIVLDREISYRQVEEVLRCASQSLLTGFAPFDLFVDASGQKLDAAKKSLAVSLHFQSTERTLTSEEIETAVGDLKEQLRQKLRAEFRE